MRTFTIVLRNGGQQIVSASSNTAALAFATTFCGIKDGEILKVERIG